jgi:subtilisin family serine protease
VRLRCLIPLLLLAVGAVAGSPARADRPVFAQAAGQESGATKDGPAATWALTRVDARGAWDITRGSPSTVIGVLDTGVDPQHPDLARQLVAGHDFVDGGNDTADDNWHGTAVAGVAAAAPSADGLTVSYCARCSIMPVKVLDADERGSDDTIARGITWAVDHGARVLNLSFNGDGESPALARALRYATMRRVVVVAAAGNEGARRPSFPAADPNVIGVAATDAADEVYPWSNRGAWVTVAAPGEQDATLRGGSYFSFLGTSAAAPAVSGTAALCLSVAPGLTPKLVRKAIAAGADRLRGSQFGRLNAARTVALCARYASGS